jgi:hypothetical protein
MQDADILQLWKSYHQQVEASLQLSRRNAAALTQLKVQSALASMKPLKIFAVIVGLLWVLVGDALLVNVYPFASPFFLVSAGLQLLLTKLAIGIYLYQLVLLQQLDIDAPVVATQRHIARLRSSTLWVTRILFLQLPLWTTFYLNDGMLAEGNWALYILQGSATLAFSYAAIWLFRNIRYQNRHQKWFRLLFEGKEWSPLITSMDMLDELAAFEDGTDQAGA